MERTVGSDLPRSSAWCSRKGDAHRRGLVLGTLASMRAGHLVAAQLFGVDPRDALVLALAPACVLAASTAASLGPARRAASADPISILRRE